MEIQDRWVFINNYTLNTLTNAYLFYNMKFMTNRSHALNALLQSNNTKHLKRRVPCSAFNELMYSDPSYALCVCVDFDKNGHISKMQIAH